VDYVALVAVLAIVFGAAAAIWVDPSGIGGAVTRAFARGLCIVSGGICDADLQPCVVASEQRSKGWHVNLVVARLGNDSVLLREERSDGSVALTRMTSSSGGPDVGLSADAHLNLRGVALAAGGGLRAAALGEDGQGATWVVQGAAAADRLQALIASGAKSLPRPATTYGEWGYHEDVGAQASRGRVSASLGYATDYRHGTQTELATGRRTISLHKGEGFSGSLAFGPAQAGDGAASHDERYAVTLDRDGTPRELVVTATGELKGSVDLPPRLAQVAGYLEVPTSGDRIWASETHLDLGDPDALRAARGFVDELQHPKVYIGSLHTPTGELRRLLDERGMTEARTFAVDSSDQGAGGDLAVGIKVGGAYDVGRQRTRLVAATSRGPDGVWHRRDDCLGAA
jgi:hypothetical protein